MHGRGRKRVRTSGQLPWVIETTRIQKMVRFSRAACGPHTGTLFSTRQAISQA